MNATQAMIYVLQQKLEKLNKEQKNLGMFELFNIQAVMGNTIKEIDEVLSPKKEVTAVISTRNYQNFPEMTVEDVRAGVVTHKACKKGYRFFPVRASIAFAEKYKISQGDSREYVEDVFRSGQLAELIKTVGEELIK